MDTDYITRAGIFNHIWMGIELTDMHKKTLWDKYNVLYEISACVSEFRMIFNKKNIPLLYLFIERYKKSAIKEIASFAKGLEKDDEAVGNAVSSDKSNVKMRKNLFYFLRLHKTSRAWSDETL